MANDSFHPLAQSVFQDPDCPTLVANKQVEEEQKVSGPGTPQETSSDFSLYIILFYFIFNIIIIIKLSCEARTTPEDARRMRQPHHARVGPGGPGRGAP